VNTRLLLPIGMLFISAQAAALDVTIAPAPKLAPACLPSNNVSNCSIGLIVSVTGSEDDAMCTVNLADSAQEVVGIKRGSPVRVQWYVAKGPPGYGFSDSDGVDFVDDTQWPRQFNWPTRSASEYPSLSYWWTDRSSLGRAKYFEYELNIRNAAGTVRCYVPDRWIKNQ
jgi:hypothetical protein